MTELRLAGASTPEEADAVLASYLVRHNERFAVPPEETLPAWRAWGLPDPVEAVFCFHYPRRVANDATVSWAGRPLALPRRDEGGSWAGRAVVVEERLDGSLWVGHQGSHRPLLPAPDGPITLRARHLSRESEGRPDHLGHPVRGRPSAGHRPPPDHPWRRPLR